ncbi:hypothetical protein [Henriciella litoralis]|uniref:hypothetical protein n=1 Tax=Henriciella litoralis TaxID=568102 RepID=UPI000A00246D|nr:hypothetical protein [Henriciella litoralis]
MMVLLRLDVLFKSFISFLVGSVWNVGFVAVLVGGVWGLVMFVGLVFLMAIIFQIILAVWVARHPDDLEGTMNAKLPWKEVFKSDQSS